MYKKSIEKCSKYLLPFIQGIKLYGSDNIESNVGTMIILNNEGCFLTCKHIAEQFINTANLEISYSMLIDNLSKLKNKTAIKEFEKKNGLKKGDVILSQIVYPFKLDVNPEINIIMHKTKDIAIIKIKNLSLQCDEYPVFSTSYIKQGQSVCKLGYAFPEIDIFKYNSDKNKIQIKENGNLNLQLFPIDGMVTRVDNTQNIFETSTPGLRGQSGGPIFNPEGIVLGMQFMTSHMDLNFDINTKVKRGLELKNVNFTPFINLGIGISSIEIIEFLEKNNIKFNKI